MLRLVWGTLVPARLGLIVAVGGLLLGSGCAQPEAVESSQAVARAPVIAAAPAPVEPVAPPPAPEPPLSEAEISAEIASLRAALSRDVPQRIRSSATSDAAWIGRTQAAVAEAPVLLDRPQLMVVVDRNPRVQEMRIVLARPAGAPWEVIGGSRVSTGQPGRFDYYITPTGVFLHTDGILDYRALGTFNENHIRGLGLKGMRVWDFGWQTAKKGWLGRDEEGEIRLLLHATDPANLERRIGRQASKGCIRIPASMNRFLDVHGVLDADYERAAAEDAGIRAVLLPDRLPTKLAGNALVVVDSSDHS